VRPAVWRPPVAPSPAEQAVIKEVRRAKLFVFLRLHRHELLDGEFQAELAETYVDSPERQPPVPPARLALATILQAYTKVSDDEVIEATVMDRRWQLVLDCMGAEEPPFSKGTLVAFRKRLIESDLDRRLIERTVELAAQTKGFGAGALRAALDSSPLWGAGRVEDTLNLMGHALRKALGVIAAVQGWGQAAGTAVMAAQAGVPQLAASSLKAALDADWDDPAARDQALAQVMRSQGHGRIVTIASIGGKLSVPHLLPYSTAKFAAIGFSEGLRAELGSGPVSVTTVVPGLMRTGSHVQAQFTGQAGQEFTWFALGACLPLLSMDAERAARQIIEAVRRRRPEIILTPAGQLVSRPADVAPGLTYQILHLTQRLALPAPSGGDDQGTPGHELSPALPKQAFDRLTTLGRAAASRFNERRARLLPASRSRVSPPPDRAGAGATTRPLAVVTGASSGIGRELAVRLAEHGYAMVVAAEDERIGSVAHSLATTRAILALPVQPDLATFAGVEDL
jgi:short-subunit dehydrogenase